jgi:hypothetical protein
MVSSIKPAPIPELAQWKIDRLEIVPCGVSEEDTSCLLVRYFDFNAYSVEGDNFFLTLNEALKYASDVYGVGVSSWCVPGFPHLREAHEMYEAVLASRPNPSFKRTR